MQHLKKVCGNKMCLLTEISCIPRGNKFKGFENLLSVNFVRKKLIPHENNTPPFH